MGTTFHSTRFALLGFIVAGVSGCAEDDGSTSLPIRYPGPCAEITAIGSGDPHRTRAYTYDSDGRVETESLWPDIGMETVYQTRYLYDERGQVRETVETNNGSSGHRSVYANEYNEAGKLVRYSLDASADGEIDAVFTIRQGTNGPVERIRDDLHTDFPFDDYEVFMYDEDSRMTQTIGRRDIFQTVIAYGYDENGWVVEETYDESIVGYSTASYSSSILNIREGIERRVRYTYDAVGNRLANELIWHDGTISHTTYTYDCFERESEAAAQTRE